MKDLKIDYIKRAIKKGDLKYKIFCYFLMKINYSNERIQALEIRNKKYSKIYKKYKKYLDMYNPEKDNNVSNNKPTIWILWLQGVENAPEIVKKCIKSIKHYNGDKKIVVLTKDNLFDYIKLPKYIIEKWRKGIISNTHFSDIVRIELLYDYGGIWMDATTFCTSSLPKFFLKNDLFLYRYKDGCDKTIKYNSWFIYSKKGNRIIGSTRFLLFEYWKHERKIKEYFLLHFFLTMSFEKYQEDEKKIFCLTDDVAHTLQANFYRKFNIEEYEMIKSKSSIHKLTYKIDKEKISKGCYYDVLVNSEKHNY